MSNHQIQRIFETCAEYTAHLKDDYDETNQSDTKGRVETINLEDKLPNPNGEPDIKGCFFSCGQWF